MNKEARIEYINNNNIPCLTDLLGYDPWWEYNKETSICMEEQLVGEYLEEKE